jgi:hypothetical protein
VTFCMCKRPRGRRGADPRTEVPRDASTNVVRAEPRSRLRRHRRAADSRLPNGGEGDRPAAAEEVPEDNCWIGESPRRVPPPDASDRVA